MLYDSHLAIQAFSLLLVVLVLPPDEWWLFLAVWNLLSYLWLGFGVLAPKEVYQNDALVN